MNDINKGNYEALTGEYEEQQDVLDSAIKEERANDPAFDAKVEKWNKEQEGVENPFDKERQKAPLEAPYFSGEGFLGKLIEWADKNLPSVEWEDEARISLGISGGQPSQHYNRELFRAVKAYNSGEVYKTPRIEWNKKEVEVGRNDRSIFSTNQGLDIAEVGENAIDEENIKAKDQRRRWMNEDYS
ncbi:MAG TPA: hypothetical protein EYQ21_00165 [Flavobacteriales bacterium]|nr:hypothetical protein [Flavobacteriales bacterium]